MTKCLTDESRRTSERSLYFRMGICGWGEQCAGGMQASNTMRHSPPVMLQNTGPDRSRSQTQFGYTGTQQCGCPGTNLSSPLICCVTLGRFPNPSEPWHLYLKTVPISQGPWEDETAYWRRMQTEPCSP